LRNEKKIRVAFIYKKNYTFLTGNHFDNTTYHFFMHALKRSKTLEITFFPSESKFNTEKLKNKFDVILLPLNHSFGTPELIGIEKLTIPVICKVGDPHDAKRTGKFPFHEKFKIDYYFSFMHSSYFYKFYPKNYHYKTIILGLEPSLYKNMVPFDQRIKNKILNSGAVGNEKILSRILNSVLNPNSNSYKHYKLRTMCNKLPYVDYTSTLQCKHVGDDYPALLSKYAAAIASTTNFPTIKYWEIPAAGCLTFMEITKQNMGEHLGFIDNETAIFINEKNYKKKFEEFLSDRYNPKWKKIASAGQKFTLENLSNDNAVEHLTKLIEEIIK